MTHPMYLSGCHGVTPHPYIIAIYSTSSLGQTIDDSSSVYKWLPWSNPPSYVIAIYSKVFPFTTHPVVTHHYLL